MSIRNLTLSATLLLTAAACGGGGGSGVGLMGGGGARLPGFAPASTTSVLVAAVSDQALSTLCDAKGATVLASCAGTDYCLVKVPDGSDVSSFLKELESESSVDDATPDSGVGGPEGGGSTIPLFGDDPLSQVAAQTAVSHTGAVKARSRGISGKGVLVAVIDTGVAFDHPLLAGHVSPDGWDFIDDDADPSDVGNGLDDNDDGSIDEGVGHGTFVASLVLAVAPDATILPIRALNSDGVGTASGVARAIAYAVAQGADVINFSGGLSTDLRLIQQAVEYAQSHDVVVYASAGNHAGNVDFPGVLPEVECVTALDAIDRKASFAAFGGRGRSLRHGRRHRRRAPALPVGHRALVGHVVQHGARHGLVRAAPRVGWDSRPGSCSRSGCATRPWDSTRRTRATWACWAAVASTWIYATRGD